MLKNLSIKERLLLISAIFFVILLFLSPLPDLKYEKESFKLRQYNLIPKEEEILLNSFLLLTDKCRQVFNGEKIPPSFYVSNHVFNLRYVKKYQTLVSCQFYHKQRFYFHSISNFSQAIENNFPIAFTIIAYKNFDQVEQLLINIYNRRNFYCLYVANSKSMFFQRVSCQFLK